MMECRNTRLRLPRELARRAAWMELYYRYANHVLDSLR